MHFFSELKQTTILILYTYRLNAIAKYWYLKQKGDEEKITKKNSKVSFNRRLSVAEELKYIKYAEERIIYAESNYFGVSRPTIRYWIKENWRINACH